jgi:PAS domain S-box-containing protein
MVNGSGDPPGGAFENGELHNLLSEASMEALAVHRRGVVLVANSVFCDLFGYEPSEVVGMQGQDFSAPEHRHVIDESLRSPIEETFEVFALKKDGTRFPAEVRGKAVFFKGRKVQVVSIRDLTEQKKVEQALRGAEAQYREMFENAADGFYQSTPEGKFLTVNPAMAEIWGYRSPQEMIDDIDDVAQRYVEPGLREELKRLLEERGSVNGFEVEIYSRTGEKVYTSLSAREVRSPEGELLYYEGTVLDVTERKRAEKELQDSEARYRTLVETSPDAVMLVDFSYRVLTANQRAAAMLDYESPESMQRENVLDRLLPEDRFPVYEDAIKAIVGGGILTEEYPVVRLDGSQFAAEVSIAPIPRLEGLPNAFIVVVRDISDRKEDELALRRINAELQGYAHTVSHDLKSPLSAVLAAADVLKTLIESPETEQNRENINGLIRSISTGAGRAMSLIEDLLALAEAGEEPAQVIEVDVEVVLEEIKREMAGEISDKGLQVKLADDLGVIKANRTHVYQVFSNLLSNVLAHCDSARPEVEITSLPGAADGEHRFRVRDNGHGIPRDMQENIFLPFSRGKSGKTGIGLAIVEKIVQTYRGEIDVWNDGGAVFEFTMYDAPLDSEAESEGQ